MTDHKDSTAPPSEGKAERSERSERLEMANRIIRIIGSHGRRFLSFSSDSREPVPESEERFSRFEFDARGRLWYVDKWRESRIFVHYDPTTRAGWGWRFSDGGTLLSLCRALRDFILRGDRKFLRHLGPFPEWSCGDDLWGYGDQMAVVRENVVALVGSACGPEARDASDNGSADVGAESAGETK